MVQSSQITAVLGPTNTGKTHYAIQRILAHRTAVIGLPLRLLAREVYDKLVAEVGPSVVALVTGEEKIMPARVKYWVCTVEAMPLEIGADLVAVDEIQLCGDNERGHVFTDRLLYARGLKETLFLGSETIGPRLRDLVPQARVERLSRLSDLTYAGSKKLSRMPERSAIVGFSVDEIYAIAEVMRRLKGGAAVVMGALSPRTRNAQVALYQNGDVDYLIATDAIGMGLNLDINHVAFSNVRKFDGRRVRDLMPHELGQIAGRAGRHTTNGTFGVTGDVPPLEDGVSKAIEGGRFRPLTKLNWRNSSLNFGSLGGLFASLDERPEDEALVRAQVADDERALKSLSDMGWIADAARTPAGLRTLWDVAQVPDFRKVSLSDHVELLSRLFRFLTEGNGQISADWLSKQLKIIDKTQGNIDALSKRLAFVRTWTYVSQRAEWVEDAAFWREATRDLEDRLSDALHDALTMRFVDRRTSVLMRSLKQRTSLVADITSDGEVRIDEQFVGKLTGFRFQLDPKASPDQAKTLRSAAAQALAPEYSLRADKIYNAPDSEIDLTEQGGLMWGDVAVGKLVKGNAVLEPNIEVFVDDEAGSDVAEKVKRRLSHWMDRRVNAQFEPLLALTKDEGLQGLAKGVGFQLAEALGIIPRHQIAQDVKSLDQDARGLLRKHGVRFGQFTLFIPVLLKPAPTRLRLVLSSLFEGADEFPAAPPPGLVTVPAAPGMTSEQYAKCGFRLAGDRAIRVDMVERLADMIRSEDARSGFEATADMLSITGLTLEQFAGLLTGMGYDATRGERPKLRPAPKADDADGAKPDAAAKPDDAAGETAKSDADASQKDAAKKDAALDAAPDAGLAEDAKPEAVAENAVVADAVGAGAVGAGAKDLEAKPEDAKPEDAKPEDAKPEDAKAADAKPEDEIEVFYTFTRSAKPVQKRRPAQKTKGGKPKRDGGPRKKPQHASAGPKKQKAADPDNPFAALAALKIDK